MEPFDRDYFTPWLGARRMAMPCIGKEARLTGKPIRPIKLIPFGRIGL
jgi:hypothetical protein